MADRLHREDNLSPREIEELRGKASAELLFEGIEEGEPERAATLKSDPGAERPRLEVSEVQLERIRQEMESDLVLRKYLDTLRLRPEFSQGAAPPEIDEKEWAELTQKTKVNFSGYLKWRSGLTGEKKRLYKYLRGDFIGENAALRIEGDSVEGAGPEGLASFQFRYRAESSGHEPAAWINLGTFHFGERYGGLAGPERTMVGAFLFTAWKRELEALYNKYGGRYTERFYNGVVHAAMEVIGPEADAFIRALRKSRAKKQGA